VWTSTVGRFELLAELLLVEGKSCGAKKPFVAPESAAESGKTGPLAGG
jgi:hypothetical protein